MTRETQSYATWYSQERSLFLDQHPKSQALHQANQNHYLYGVPLHWMHDWPSPFPLYIARAQGVCLTCVDGQEYTDFCLGDTAAMFGHSPDAVTVALSNQAAMGLTCMLPAHNTLHAAELLEATFNLPMWQFTVSASDANRFVLRWARALTARSDILVFDGCYHGCVEDTLVDMRTDRLGATVARASVLGLTSSQTTSTLAIAFNDLEALEQVLATRKIAALLAEPALTNCGLVPPLPDFWRQAQALCARYGTLLILDETHTLSYAHGGYAKALGISPDFLVIGKAIAAGLPCAVYGFSRALGQRMQALKAAAPAGHSGIGTTLAGNALTMAALEACLSAVNTADNYRHMLALADELVSGIRHSLNKHARAWTVTQWGARLEIQFMPQTPRSAADVRVQHQAEFEHLLHLYMLNRGLLLTPFHSMLLISPATRAADITTFLQHWDTFCSLAPRAIPALH